MTLPAIFLSPQSPQAMLLLLNSNLSYQTAADVSLAGFPRKAKTTPSLPEYTYTRAHTHTHTFIFFHKYCYKLPYPL